MDSSEPNRIVCMRFNQDYSCFVCGTEKGFHVFSSVPFKDTFQRNLGGGLGIAEMFYKSNILALVGGGIHAKFPSNKAMIWDDRQNKCIGELSFKTPVFSVKLRKDKLVVVLETRIYVYNFVDFYFLDSIDTFPNPTGCCALTGNGAAILACPMAKEGELRIKNYSTGVTIEKKAHETALVAIALSHDGRLCATASKKGTLLRIFSTDDGRLLQELRRGKDKAEIYCIAFDRTNKWIACTSNKGTVHIFTVIPASKAAAISLSIGESDPNLQNPSPSSPMPEEIKEFPAASSPIKDGKHLEKKKSQDEESKIVDPKNPTSVFKFMKGIVPYFSSEWSFAKFKIPEKYALVGFGPADSNQVIVIASEGKYILAEFDPKLGGECKLIVEKNIPIQE